MKTLRRNTFPFWYLLLDKSEPIRDEYGNETSECRLVYKPAVKMQASISANSGMSAVLQFGNFPDYDKVILVDDPNCPIDENAVLFVDKSPEYNEDGNPVYDYVVQRVSRSLNTVAYGIRKVAVS